MKKINLVPAILIVFASSAYTQNETDALRYSQNFYGGTARSMSMSGAFGALGGDFTSASTNPAGIGVYRSTELTFTPTLLYNNTETSYLGKSYFDQEYRFVLNNLSFVSTKDFGRDNGWVSVSFGAGYNQLNNYSRQTYMQGMMLKNGSTSSSYLDNFSNNANDGVWSDFYEQLAWDGFVMYYDTLQDEYWNDLMDQGYGQSLSRAIMEKGGLGEYAFTFGANYGNRLYVGATFGIHQLRYSQEIDHMEIDHDNVVDFFDSFRMWESLEAKGTGYSFKAGIIFRPISMIRLGAAFHVPTFYKIREDFYTEMKSTFDKNTGEADGYAISPPNYFEYNLRTPYKAIFSLGIQIPKLATFDLDYEMTDYRLANLDSPSDRFRTQNETIRNVYTMAHNFRLGGEILLGPIYLRAGGSYYDSPYKKGEVNEDSYTIGVSGGFGFRSENVFFDLGYSYRNTESRNFLYIPEDVNGALTKTDTQQFMATLGFRF